MEGVDKRWISAKVLRFKKLAHWLLECGLGSELGDYLENGVRDSVVSGVVNSIDIGMKEMGEYC